MFKGKNDQEAFTSAMDAYIRDHAPISCDDLVRAMKEQGYDCSPRMVRPHLRESGLHVKNVSGHWLWGTWEEQREILPNLAEKTSSDGGMVQERQQSNERMTQERDALWTAVQKSVELRKEIKSAQERLLVEIADLIHSTYGQTPSTSPREPETQSEAD